MSYALITGASGGIGLALATELAKSKFNLLLIARSEDKLKEAAQKLASTHNIRVEVFAVDLSEQDSAHRVLNWVNQNSFPVSVLINNAGYGVWGEIQKTPLADLQNMMRLNMLTLVDLSYLLLPTLKNQKQSYILNVASTAAYQAVPTLATYAASKAFVVLFTRGLRKELKGTNVSVTCLSPGTTTTNFMDRANMGTAIQSKAAKVTMSSEAVAKIAIKGMFNKKAEVIPGFVNWLSVQLTYLVPKSIPEEIAAGIYKG